MANNVFIYNGAIEGATGGVHERWIFSTASADYSSIRNIIVQFATLVDALIPTNPAISAADGALIQSITHGVLAHRYLKSGDDMTAIAQAIVALYSSLSSQQLPELITTDSVINVSTLPGSTLTSTLNVLSGSIVAGSVPGAVIGVPGSPSNPGYISETYYDNGDDGLIWTAVTDIPAGNWFEFMLRGSGGGAGAGYNGPNSNPCNGGGPGGGGAANYILIARQTLIDALPITFTLPLGGNGGAAVAGFAGNDGSPGAAASISGTNLALVAFGGGRGSSGPLFNVIAGGGGGGGQQSAGANSSTVNGGNGGGFGGGAGPSGGNSTQIAGGGAGNGTAAAGGGTGVYGGGGGGSARPVTVGLPTTGGGSLYGGGGGGGGGSYNNTGPVVQTGAAGGGKSTIAASGNGLGAAAGQDGAPCSFYVGGQGGGGGSAVVSPADQLPGGHGGAGGGGGGGGGARGNAPGGVLASGGNGGEATCHIRAYV